MSGCTVVPTYQRHHQRSYQSLFVDMWEIHIYVFTLNLVEIYIDIALDSFYLKGVCLFG